MLQRAPKPATKPTIVSLDQHLNAERSYIGTHVGGVRLHVVRYRPEKISKLPLICLPGFYRNARDFETMAGSLLTNKKFGREIICIDLPGRGFSSHLNRSKDYSSNVDAACVYDALLALNVPRGILLAQAHGGHIASILATQHPSLVAGAILINCGPLINPLSLVRMRQTLERLTAVNQYHEAERAFSMIYGESFERVDSHTKQYWISRVIDKKNDGTGQPLLDNKLSGMLKNFDADPSSLTCWTLMGSLKSKPVLSIRVGDTDQLTAETFSLMKTVWPEWWYAKFEDDPNCLTLESLELHEEIEIKLRRMK